MKVRRRSASVVALAAMLVTGALVIPGAHAAASGSEFVVGKINFPYYAGMKTLDDPASPSGRVLEIFRNTGTETTLVSTAPTIVKTSARATECIGFPNVIVRVDGVPVISSPATATYQRYSSTKTIPAGTHRVRVEMTGDVYNPRVCDRNLYVDTIRALEY